MNFKYHVHLCFVFYLHSVQQMQFRTVDHITHGACLAQWEEQWEASVLYFT